MSFVTHTGDVVCAGRGIVEFVLNAFRAEMIGCIQGVQAAVNVGITDLILETDATLVQQAVNHGDHRTSLAGSLLYRWPNGSGTMGQPGPGPKKHDTSMARHDVHSARAGTGTILGHAWAEGLARSAGTGTARLMGRHDGGPIILDPWIDLEYIVCWVDLPSYKSNSLLILSHSFALSRHFFLSILLPSPLPESQP